jgi:hypothetical protein
MSLTSPPALNAPVSATHPTRVVGSNLADHAGER